MDPLINLDFEEIWFSNHNLPRNLHVFRLQEKKLQEILCSHEKARGETREKFGVVNSKYGIFRSKIPFQFLWNSMKMKILANHKISFI
jgi:hypothetical protein